MGRISLRCGPRPQRGCRHFRLLHRLFSYYNFDNWTYQPSFVSSNTPWFFNGLRIQYFPTTKLKIEPWIINGCNRMRAPMASPVSADRFFGAQAVPRLRIQQLRSGRGRCRLPGRSRIHADYSAQVKYYDKPTKLLDKAAFTVTGMLVANMAVARLIWQPGWRIDPKANPRDGHTDTYNGGVNCRSSKGGRPKQAFLGYMIYDRMCSRRISTR